METQKISFTILALQSEVFFVDIDILREKQISPDTTLHSLVISIRKVTHKHW